MTYKRKIIPILMAVFLMIALGISIVVYGSLHQKYTFLRYRIQLLETQADSYGLAIGARIASYQHQRSNARFVPVLSRSAFDRRGTWEQIGGDGIRGSWRGGYFSKTKALTVYRGGLVAGLLGPRRGDAAVWQFDGEAWRKIGGGGMDGSWRNLKYVQVLKAKGEILFAGIDHTVWRYRSGKWVQLPCLEKLANGSCNKSLIAYSMAIFRGALHVGVTGGKAIVYRWSGKRWSRTGMRVTRGVTGVYELFAHTDGRLYAGMITNPGPTEVRVYDGTRWDKIGGGVGGSWRNPGFTYVLSFTSFQGKLVATMNRQPMGQSKFTSIWAFDGGEWRPVAVTGTPPLWGETPNFNASVVYQGRLYVSAGGHPAGNTSIWELTSTSSWRQVAGHGILGSWGSPNRARMSPSRHSPSEYIYRMIAHDGNLVVSFGDSDGMAKIWRYRPASGNKLSANPN